VIFGARGGTRVYAVSAAVDMRKSFDTLAALVASELKKPLLGGDLFLFVGRSRKRAKILYFDGTGLCLLAKRLEKGHFMAPWKESGGSQLTLSMSELALFLEGSQLQGRLPLSPTVLQSRPVVEM